jgi:hypothetical protein
MTVTLDLTPELETCAAAQGVAQGLSMEAYLLSIIEAAAAPASAAWASLEELEAVIGALAGGLDDVPVLAPEAFTREAIYGHRG